MSEREFHLVVLTPVFNDWACVRRLIQELGQELAAMQHKRPTLVQVVIVDDGSVTECSRSLFDRGSGRD